MRNNEVHKKKTPGTKKFRWVNRSGGVALRGNLMHWHAVLRKAVRLKLPRVVRGELRRRNFISAIIRILPDQCLGVGDLLNGWRRGGSSRTAGTAIDRIGGAQVDPMIFRNAIRRSPSAPSSRLRVLDRFGARVSDSGRELDSGVLAFQLGLGVRICARFPLLQYQILLGRLSSITLGS